MAELPPPLTPADCTMRGNDWFPLAFRRLRKSKWWRRASDLARARNVMLWGEAYSSTPAGSLDDDDDELAEAAGFGMDVAAFLHHKAEIMAPWTLCSDGRWYHPTVAEVALDTWNRTAERRKKDLERQNRHRAKKDAKRGRSPEESVRDKPGVTRENDAQRARLTGQDRTDIEAATPSATQPGRAEDWPDVEPARMLDVFAAAVGSPWLDPSKNITPKFHAQAPGYLRRWRDAGCSWLADVLPVASARAKVAGSPIHSLKYFDQAILDAHRARTAAYDPATGDHHVDKLARKRANLERSLDGADLVHELVRARGGDGFSGD